MINFHISPSVIIQMACKKRKKEKKKEILKNPFPLKAFLKRLGIKSR
jgi:hypothetical protein